MPVGAGRQPRTWRRRGHHRHPGQHTHHHHRCRWLGSECDSSSSRGSRGNLRSSTSHLGSRSSAKKLDGCKPLPAREARDGSKTTKLWPLFTTRQPPPPPPFSSVSLRRPAAWWWRLGAQARAGLMLMPAFAEQLSRRRRRTRRSTSRRVTPMLTGSARDTTPPARLPPPPPVGET
jgi:hypothetical protein